MVDSGEREGKLPGVFLSDGHAWDTGFCFPAHPFRLVSALKVAGLVSDIEFTQCCGILHWSSPGIHQ